MTPATHIPVSAPARRRTTAHPAHVSSPIRPSLPQVTSSRGAASCACGGTCPRCSGGPSATAHAVQSTVARPGQALTSELRHRLESQFRTNLSDVRLHTDQQSARAAVQANASAFAFGRHIAFGPGLYSPDTTEGYRRLAHEVTHVVQQRGASPTHPNLEPVASLETEARGTATKAAQDPHAALDVSPTAAAQGHVQRDDPPSPLLNRPDLRHPWTSQGQFQFQMSPEMQRMMLEMQFQRWLAAQTATVPPDAVPPLSTTGPTGTAAPTDAPSPVTGPILPSPTDLARTVEDHGPMIPYARPAPTSSASDAAADLPDMSALMSPFLTRGVPIGSRDPAAAMQLYTNAFNWVSLLPDPPAPFGRWIPGNWRVSLSESLAGMAINNSPFRLDFPTPTERFDRELLNLTNDPSTVPTYINLPALHF